MPPRNTLLPLLSKSHSHSKTTLSVTYWIPIPEALFPHKTVSLCLRLQATYILLVVLYFFIPLKMELFIGRSMFMGGL